MTEVRLLQDQLDPIDRAVASWAVVLAESVAATLGQILTSDARDGDKIRAAAAILDRAGVGPHWSQGLSVGLSLVEQWAAELEARGPSSDVDSDSA